jgi:pimeloyl-ACP methyl ester carboxylesterase
MRPIGCSPAAAFPSRGSAHGFRLFLYFAILLCWSLAAFAQNREDTVIDHRTAVSATLVDLSASEVVPAVIEDNAAYAFLRTPEGLVRRPIARDAKVAYGIYKGWALITRSWPDAQQELVAIEVGTGAEYTVVRADQILRVTWQPGGEHCGVQFRRGSRNHVAVYSIAQRKLKEVRDSAEANRFLTWSRDGAQLYFGIGDAERVPIAAYDLRSGSEVAPPARRLYSHLAQFATTAGNHDPGPADGISVLENLEDSNLSLDYRTPIILVHGINEQDSWALTITTKAWDNMIAYIQGDYTLKNKYKLYRFSYTSNVEPVYQLARSLRNHIDEAIHAGQINDLPLVLIAHSMGGLISRSYMAQHSQYEGTSWMTNQRGGKKTIKTITLATPHHGSPVANGASRDALIANADRHDGYSAWELCTWSQSVNFAAWKVTHDFYDETNRSDLWWDNFDGSMGTMPPPSSVTDIHSIISDLNNDTTFDYKLITYWGYLDPNGIAYQNALSDVRKHQCVARLLSADNYIAGSIGMTWGLTDASGNPYYPKNDSAVPTTSAAFNGHTVAKQVECPGYNHTELQSGASDGKLCANGLGVLASVGADLNTIRPSATPTRASMQTPVPSSTLSGSPVTFTWSSGSAVSEYVLTIGSSQGASDIYTASQGIETSASVSIPQTATTIWVRLASRMFGNLYNEDYSYTLYHATSSLTTSSDSVAFSSVSVGSASTLPLTLQNNGAALLHITSLPITGSGAAAFSLVSPPSLPATINPGAPLPLSIRFSPAAATGYSASLCISNDSANSPSKCISLSGSGVVTATSPSTPTLIAPGSPTSPGQQIPTTTPTFTWNASPQATYYGIYISRPPYGCPANCAYQNDNIGSSPSFSLPSGFLQDGGQYRWNVVAGNASGTSAPATQYYFRVSLTSNPPSVSGISPSGPVANATAQTVTVSGAGFVTGATVFFAAPDSSNRTVTQFTSLSANAITMQVKLDIAGSWTVSVVNANNQSSNAYPFQVGAAPQKPGSFQLSADPASCNPSPSTVPIVHLSWTASAQAASYVVYRNSSPAGSAANGALSWTDPSTLTAGSTYTYFAVATNAQGSTQSNSVPVSIPADICYSQQAGNIVLGWSSAPAPSFSQGQPPSSLGLPISNDSGAPMRGTAVSNASWMTVNGFTSYTWTARETVTVTFNPTGLSAGSYTGRLTISSPQATNGPIVETIVMTVSTPLVIATTSDLPDAVAGKPYGATLVATGGSGYTWRIESGTLPTGLSLDPSSGVISGIVGSISGSTSRSLNISVQDSLGRYIWQTFNINWLAGVVISTPASGTPQWTVGNPVLNGTGYNFTASGGNAPYTWSATGLPGGLSIDSGSGVISGTPTTAGAYTITLTVTRCDRPSRERSPPR